MSSRNTTYDSGESRRSPRDRSPGRYNDSRDSEQYRGGAARGGERRRSIPDIRNQNAFASNRDTFRDSRDVRDSRDFPPRDAPRGPKALEAPSGPRSSSYGGDYRGDFGFRGDFRGGRGRGRGRGGWRDDSRDRGREGERDYRQARDDRGPPFRDDRNRDRDRWDRNDNFRGRRPSSPQGRSRSPTYRSRDTRDGLSNLDFDRTRRDSRDAPLPGGSPAPDSLQPSGFGRGYGRGRGNRGRGRGSYYDDYVARIPSPDPNVGRRTQPSATPPPQVPAFGSTSSNVPIPKGPKAEMSDAALGPVPGVAVPTAPRARHMLAGRQNERATSVKWTSLEFAAKQKPTDAAQQETTNASSEYKLNAPTEPGNRPRSSYSHSEEKQIDPKSDRGLEPQLAGRKNVTSPRVAENKSPRGASRNLRQPLSGKHPIELPVLNDVLNANGSDSDSGDEFNDEYFEQEIKSIEGKVKSLTSGELFPILAGNYRQEEDNWYINPFIESSIDKQVTDRMVEMFKACTAVGALQTPALVQKTMHENTFSVKPKSKGRSRPNTPLAESDVAAKLRLSGAEHTAQSEPQASPRLRDIRAEPQLQQSIRQAVSPSLEELDLRVPNPEIKLEAPVKSAPNSRNRKSVPIDTFDQSESEPESELIEPTDDDIEAVRKKMKTPPLVSLPIFNCGPWYQDEEFLKTLKPDPAVTTFIMNKITERNVHKERDQEKAAQQWKGRYYDYRRWTDYSDDQATVKSRETFASSREKKAAEVAASLAAIPTSGSKLETQRRAGSRNATEHDIERILRVSEQEAREAKEREERLAGAHTASAKEAKIPDMCWNDDERLETAFADRTHLVSFERSFAVLEFGEPVDNFTEEECELFEKGYLDTPKQWGKIAESLPRRDYKACIQHYYLVKRTTQLKEKVKKQKKKTRRTTAPKGAKPKSNALMADIVNRDEGEEGADGDNGGERRRPRRAAAPTFNNSEATPGDSDAPSPALTPGRKPTAAPKGDSNSNEPGVPKKRKPRAPSQKQAKNSQLLAAAPPNRVTGSPGLQPNAQTGRGSMGANLFPHHYEGASAQSNFAPQYASPNERASTSVTSNLDVISQPFGGDQEPLGSAPPSGFDAQQDRRNLQTSSYWSVPEVNDFPALLQHFGTDWGAIAKHMTSKTHVMVYTTVFQKWLTIPLDKNKSRRVANILAQVKNYYTRQVDSGKMSTWEQIAKEADEKKARGESTGPLPVPTPIPKRRYDVPQGSLQRAGSAMEIDDIPPVGQSILMAGSPPQPTLSTRFPALAQAGSVPPSTMSPHASSTVLSKHIPHQLSQQTSQQMQNQSRPQRGPALGYFNTDPQRPIMQASNTQHAQSTPPMPDPVSQRSLMVAQEAQIERQQALRLEREQAQAQAQAQQLQVQQAQAQAHHRATQNAAMERDRHLQMKQEADPPNPNQYEPYPHPSLRHTNVTPHSRPEVSHSLSQPDVRGTAPPQQYQPPNHQAVRSLLSDNAGGGRDMKSTPPPALPRAPMSAPPASQEQYSAPPSRMTPAAPIRQPETIRKTSSIMSLLNDEPSDPRPQPPKRVSDVASTTHLQSSHTPPPPQQLLQPSRYSSLSSQSSSQPTPASQQMAPMASQHQSSQQQHSYQQPQHPIHQHSSSIGQSRSYTPTSFENRSYGTSSMQQQQQSMYAQAPRQAMAPQSQPNRRDPSLGEIHGVTTGYGRSSTASQPSMRLKESPYSATPTAPSQPSRPQNASPLELAQPSERDYYSRQPSYMMQQQSSAVASPQLGPTYHPQAQQQQPSHRQMAFGQGLPHTTSPPPSYATQHPLHRSRQNSFDGRYPAAVSSAPPTQHGYAQAPPHQSAPLSMQYQQQTPQERFESGYDRERERRALEEQHHQQRLEQHRLDQQRLDQQRLEEQRRRGFP